MNRFRKSLKDFTKTTTDISLRSSNHILSKLTLKSLTFLFLKICIRYLQGETRLRSPFRQILCASSHRLSSRCRSTWHMSGHVQNTRWARSSRILYQKTARRTRVLASPFNAPRAPYQRSGKSWRVLQVPSRRKVSM